jgi:hypothetical protein
MVILSYNARNYSTAVGLVVQRHDMNATANSILFQTPVLFFLSRSPISSSKYSTGKPSVVNITKQQIRNATVKNKIAV